MTRNAVEGSKQLNCSSLFLHEPSPQPIEKNLILELVLKSYHFSDMIVKRQSFYSSD